MLRWKDGKLVEGTPEELSEWEAKQAAQLVVRDNVAAARLSGIAKLKAKDWTPLTDEELDAIGIRS